MTPAEEYPEKNHKQDLAGGVDLASPIAKNIDVFKQQMLQAKATAIVMIGQVGTGSVLFAAIAPHGEVQILGLLEKAGQILAEQGRERVQGARDVPRFGL